MAVEQPSEEQQLAAEQPSEEEERVAAQPSEEEGEAAFKARFWARANYFAEWHARYAILNDWKEWEVPEDGLEWVGYLCPLEWEVLRSHPHFHIWQSKKPEELRDMLEYDAKMTMAIKGWGEAICSKFGLSYARQSRRTCKRRESLLPSESIRGEPPAQVVYMAGQHDTQHTRRTT